MKRNRVGFTLVELLVVITIIGILMGLLIPAVNAARETARRNQCNTQLKNFALAGIQYENSKGQLPGWVHDYGTFADNAAEVAPDPSDPGNWGGAVPRHKKIGTWAVALMPWLEAQPTYEHWTEDRYPIITDGAGTFSGTTGASGVNFHILAAPNLPIFQCPSNPVAAGDQGLNSYVANNGMSTVRTAAADPAGGAVAIATFAESQDRANGAINCKYVGSDGSLSPGLSVGPRVTLDDFKDGQGNTILFSESVQALPWHRAGFVNAADLLIAAPVADISYSGVLGSSRYTQGMVWHYEDSQAATLLAMTTPPTSPSGASVIAVYEKHKINGGGTTVDDDIFNLDMNATNAPDLARPSSAHVDGVNTGMADGGTRFILKSIDYRVYQALLNLRGKSSDVPWKEFVLTDEVL